MNSELAKNIARSVGAAAMCACLLSLSVQGLALVGVYTTLLVDVSKYLFIGLFPFMFLAIGAQHYLLSRFYIRDSLLWTHNPQVYAEGWRRVFAGNVIMKQAKGKVPQWLPIAVKVLAANALAQLVISMFQTHAARGSESAILMFGAFAASGYSYAAMMLLSYAKFDHPLLPGDFV